MTDDWSLKGKAVVIMCGIQGMYVFPESKKEHLPKDAVFVYKKQDIETLRQKLIDESKNFQDTVLARVSSHLTFPLKSDPETQKLVSEISMILNEEFRKYQRRINRCFGVEEVENAE